MELEYGMDSIEKKIFQQAMLTIEKKSYYLEINDKDGFQRNIDGILMQIEVFEKCDNESENLLQKTYQNTEEIFKQIQDVTLKSGDFSCFVMLLQKMAQIPSDEKGKTIWNNLESALNDFLQNDSEGNFNNIINY